MRLFTPYILGFIIFSSVVAAVTFVFITRDKHLNPSANYRSPSSLVDVTDGDFSDETLVTQIKSHILKGLKVIEIKDYSGIELGGFYLNSLSGDSIFACDEFPRFTLLFEGEGVAHSGAKPQLELQIPCLESPDGQIEAVLIPNYELAQTPPFEGETQLTETGIVAHFYNTREQWPMAWALTGIYFENASGATQIEISLADLMRWVGQPVGITWPTNNPAD